MDQVKCRKCSAYGVAAVSGPGAKNPGRIYYTCTECRNEKGQPLFIQFGGYETDVVNTPPPPPKRQKVDPPTFPLKKEEVPLWAKTLNQKVDMLLGKFEELFSRLEPPLEDQNTQDERIV